MRRRWGWARKDAVLVPCSGAGQRHACRGWGWPAVWGEGEWGRQALAHPDNTARSRRFLAGWEEASRRSSRPQPQPRPRARGRWRQQLSSPAAQLQFKRLLRQVAALRVVQPPRVVCRGQREAEGQGEAAQAQAAGFRAVRSWAGRPAGSLSPLSCVPHSPAPPLSCPLGSPDVSTARWQSESGCQATCSTRRPGRDAKSSPSSATASHTSCRSSSDGAAVAGADVGAGAAAGRQLVKSTTTTLDTWWGWWGTVGRWVGGRQTGGLVVVVRASRRVLNVARERSAVGRSPGAHFWVPEGAACHRCIRPRAVEAKVGGRELQRGVRGDGAQRRRRRRRAGGGLAVLQGVVAVVTEKSRWQHCIKQDGCCIRQDG